MKTTIKHYNPSAYKDTFWNKVRVEKGFKLQEIADYLHCSIGSVGSYFSGQTVPSEKVIKALCEYFEIAEPLGTRAFVEDNKAWHAEHVRVYRVPAQKVTKSKKPKKKTEEVAPVVTEAIPTKADVTTKVVELIYGKIPYDAFVAITEGKEDILAYLYGKVDYKTYLEIAKVLA